MGWGCIRHMCVAGEQRGREDQSQWHTVHTPGIRVLGAVETARPEGVLTGFVARDFDACTRDAVLTHIDAVDDHDFADIRARWIPEHQPRVLVVTIQFMSLVR